MSVKTITKFYIVTI